MPKKESMKKILVIRHGALGDIIYTLGAFKAIRNHHRKDQIVLLTSSPYKGLCASTGYFDEIYLDNREKFYKFWSTWDLRSWFRKQQFDRVYDLQTSKRTNWYFRMWGPDMPEWSGVAPGCSHYQDKEARKSHHILKRFEDQLSIAGIEKTSWPSADWYNFDKDQLDSFNLPKDYILLVPGSSQDAPYKRWSVDGFAGLANSWQKKGIQSVVIGSKIESMIAQELQEKVPGLINLATKTTMLDVFGLAKNSKAIVGNDTGPTHMAAITHKPTVMLFSGSHDPERIAPPFPTVKWILKSPLSDLTVNEVNDSLEKLLK